MREFDGDFETHVTIQTDDTSHVWRLRAWAAGRGLKVTHIVLARGDMPSQPMLTRHGRGTSSTELAAAKALADALRADGFSVSRIKLEAAPWNRDVPQSEADWSGQAP